MARLSPRPFARLHALKLSAVQARKDAELRSKNEEEEGERLCGRQAKRAKLDHQDAKNAHSHSRPADHTVIT